ncbi:MAG: hypothetical protein AB7G23_11405 [Vicinamibacterales bacterium]
MRSRTQQRVEGLAPSRDVQGERRVQMVLVTSPGSISSSPASFYGVPVSVHASVSEYHNPHSFTIEEDAWWKFDDDVLVMIPSPEPGAVALDDDTFVTVVGTVRPFIRAEFERDYDWFDFDNSIADIDVNLEGRPVIVADIARTSDGAILAQTNDQRTRILVASPGDIADTPARFYGRTVAVRQEVEDIWSSRAFTLDEDSWWGGEDVLVLNPYPAALPGAFDDYEGEDVIVYGTVRPYIASELQQDYAWYNPADADFDLDDREGRPVIVASSIRTEEGQELVQFRPELALDQTEGRLAQRMNRWPDLVVAVIRERSAPQATDRAAQGSDRAANRRNSSGQATDQAQRRQGAVQAAEAVTSLAALRAGNPLDLLGRPVDLRSVRVQRVVDSRTYVVGPSANQTVTVRVHEAPDDRIQAGERVSINGIVGRAADQGSNQRMFYVDAREIAPAS